MTYTQTIYSAPRRIFSHRGLSPKGHKLLVTASSKKEKKAIWDKYGKNYYKDNPLARPLHQIKHD
jgi:hypothetical protein